MNKDTVDLITHFHSTKLYLRTGYSTHASLTVPSPCRPESHIKTEQEFITACTLEPNMTPENGRLIN